MHRRGNTLSIVLGGEDDRNKEHVVFLWVEDTLGGSRSC